MTDWIKCKKVTTTIEMQFDHDRLTEAMVAYARAETGAKGPVKYAEIQAGGWETADGTVIFDEGEEVKETP